MLTKTNIIVLSKLKYKDYDLIIKAYTKHHGIVSYLIRGALKPSKKGKSKAIYFQPLMQLSVEENFNPNKSLQVLRDIKVSYVYTTLYTNIYKSAIVIFLSEILDSVLKEEEKNEDLFNFIATTFQYLDNEDEFANFHILFLLKLSRYLGFLPSNDNKDLPFFNLQTGFFEDKHNGINSIRGKNLTLLKRLLGINFDAVSSIKINVKDRQDFLSMLLSYFELHLEGFKKPKSLAVLSEVFR
ncbi:MAG: DNA repair protein RecO [Winogradskyella sp.]|uniref:DNA repair protein RecO n=1 Tax=Winogradskyella sp. TaxID=1883156 RepID=UPI000F3DF657|nr:DNA repair protein RecO [Winogradskyella sp.]RNC88362.1 MAG: DNA repair protein RecO [Winogradskyella sp.]